MIKTLGSFAQERVGSLVSKKVGAAVAGSAVALGAEGQAQDTVVIITVAYILAQALVDVAKALRGA